VQLGRLIITYELEQDGTMPTTLSVEGEIPVAVQLGLLELAKDTILRCSE
jgi:hypothetical protein